MLIDKVDQDGAALAGACFQLLGTSNVGPVCDNGAADTDPAEGKIGIDNVPEGTYTLSETHGARWLQPGRESGHHRHHWRTRHQVQVVNQPTAPQVGILAITVSDDAGNALGGACFSYGGTNICDNGIGDENPAAGQIQVSGVRVGTYQIVQTIAPTGFQIAEAQSADIVASETTTVDVRADGG